MWEMNALLKYDITCVSFKVLLLPLLGNKALGAIYLRNPFTLILGVEYDPYI